MTGHILTDPASAVRNARERGAFTAHLQIFDP